jgi:hypothetical protein
MGGGAWPFLVGGVICLVNSVNERDLSLLNSYANFTTQGRWGGGRIPARLRVRSGRSFRPRLVKFVDILLRGTVGA